MYKVTLYDLNMKPRITKTESLPVLTAWLRESFGPDFHKYGSIRLRLVDAGVYATGAKDLRGVSWVVVLLPLE